MADAPGLGHFRSFQLASSRFNEIEKPHDFIGKTREYRVGDRFRFNREKCHKKCSTLSQIPSQTGNIISLYRTSFLGCGAGEAQPDGTMQNNGHRHTNQPGKEADRAGAGAAASRKKYCQKCHEK